MTWMTWYNSLVVPSWTLAPSTIRLMWTGLDPVIVVSFGFVFVQAIRYPEPQVDMIAHRTEGTITTPCDRVRLRAAGPGDLPGMFKMQLDPGANHMAATNPRGRAALRVSTRIIPAGPVRCSFAPHKP